MVQWWCISPYSYNLCILAWHIVHGVPCLVERDDVVEPSSGLAGIHVVVASNLASGVQRVILNWIERRRGPRGAGHWRHWRTCWTGLNERLWNTNWIFCLTSCKWMKRKCSINSSSLKYCLHDEVVWSMDPKRVISKPLSENVVAL